MAQGFIQVPPDSTGSKIPTVGWTDGADSVEAQQVALAQATPTTGSITSTQSVTATDVRGFSMVAIELSGTYTGGVIAQPLIDMGAGLFSSARGIAAGGTAISSTQVLVDNSTNVWYVPTLGATQARVTGVSVSSGTVAVRIVPIAGPNPMVALLSTSLVADTELPAAAALSDALNRTTSVPMVGAATLLDDGVTQLFRAKGNMDGTALASAARTTTSNSTDITNFNGRGVVLYVNVTSVTATPLLQVNVQGKDPISAGYYKLAADPTAVGATGLFVYEFYPGSSAAAAGGVTARVAAVVPRVFRVLATHGDTDSITYSIAYSLIL